MHTFSGDIFGPIAHILLTIKAEASLLRQQNRLRSLGQGKYIYRCMSLFNGAFCCFLSWLIFILLCTRNPFVFPCPYRNVFQTGRKPCTLPSYYASSVNVLFRTCSILPCQWRKHSGHWRYQCCCEYRRNHGEMHQLSSIASAEVDRGRPGRPSSGWKTYMFRTALDRIHERLASEADFGTQHHQMIMDLAAVLPGCQILIIRIYSQLFGSQVDDVEKFAFESNVKVVRKDATIKHYAEYLHHQSGALNLFFNAINWFVPIRSCFLLVLLNDFIAALYLID